MTAVALLVLVWTLSAVLMTLGWLWQRRRCNAGIVDVLWAGGLAGSALLCAALGSGARAPRLLLSGCAGVWGLRLAGHLWRRLRAQPEDGRYQALRARWHDDQRKWFGMFQFQAALIALFSVPFVIVAANPATRPAWLAAGAALCCLSVAGEARADSQLARFRAEPANRGRTCRVGLWRYSRHPNYFFEWLHWFTYAALAVGARHAWLALAGPLVMFVFLRFVSGIPFTEAQALRTRGEDYRDYQRRTSMLFPWPPRRQVPSPSTSGDARHE
jgi:steroid 5-alpha reductase family enzyme